LDALRAASLSGDWRRIDGSLELVAALAVNVPGFPIPRTQASMAASAQTALVASGIVQPEPDKSDLTLVYEALSVMGSKLDALLGPEDEDEDDEVHGDYPPMGRLAAVLDLSNKLGVT
jgi:hypothetical protein